MNDAAHSISLAALCAAVMFIASAMPSAGSAGLTNPAAEYCIASGGFYGLRDGENGKFGVCVLASGDEVDAWEYFRENTKTETDMDEPKIANPAATYCAALGGTYNLETSTCLLPDGSEVDAWALLREAHTAAASLANPAATYCIERGGTYEIRNGEGGQFGICRLPDGTENDAWALFRNNN